MSEPKPSYLYPIIKYFAHERHSIYLNRLSGRCSSWTKDEILRRHKFTNTFRACDRVSQYLISDIINGGESESADDIFFKTLFFKTFNKISTWQRLQKKIGPISRRGFSISRYGKALAELKYEEAIYSSAYIMPSGGGKFPCKHEMHLALLKRMLEDDLCTRLQEAKSLEQVYSSLRKYDTIGPFLAFQYAIDINYSSITNHSEMDFVVAGPGAIDGLSKCFESLGDYTAEDTIKWISDRQLRLIKNSSRQSNEEVTLFGRPLQLIDIQNVLCEVSKYTRESNPEKQGVSGRTRIKQKYTSHGPLPHPVFPKKWGLHEAVRRWLGENASLSNGHQLNGGRARSYQMGA
jgi:hypothetical protein